MRGPLLLVALASAPAYADDTNGPAPDQHRHQLGISARFDLGVRGIATYNNMLYCGATDSGAAYGYASVCTGRSPLSFDLEASYGVSTTVELLVGTRLGIERDFGNSPSADGPRELELTPGARFFFSEAKRTKLFIQPELVFDFSGYKDSSGKTLGTDFGVRGMEGVWIDLHRTYGVYLYVGETATVTRWFSFELEGGIGFQGRYP